MLSEPENLKVASNRFVREDGVESIVVSGGIMSIVQS